MTETDLAAARLSQSPACELPPETWDVVVAGVGPAGAVAACGLAAQGHRVLAIDRARFPRDKVCGDALIPDALAVLHRLGLRDRVESLGHVCGTMAVFSASRHRLDVPGRFVTMPRLAFDALLAGHAQRAGAVLAHGTVAGVEPGGPGVIVRLADSARAIPARAVVLATGARLEVDRASGRTSPPPTAYAARSYVRSPCRVDPLVISYDRSISPGYAWIFPLGGDLYNVGCGALARDVHSGRVHLREAFAAFTASFPVARALLSEATEVAPLKGATLRCGLEGAPPVGPGPLLSIGERIGTTFPLTGEGIGKAMETGEIAAGVLHGVLTGTDRIETFAARLASDLAPRFAGYRIGERWVGRPWLGDLIVRRASRSARLSALVAGMLDESVDPRAVFSARAIVASLFVARS